MTILKDLSSFLLPLIDSLKSVNVEHMDVEDSAGLSALSSRMSGTWAQLEDMPEDKFDAKVDPDCEEGIFASGPV